MDFSGRILVIHHDAAVPSGEYGDVLAGCGAPVEHVELHAGAPLPPLDGCRGIVTLGGPMGALDDHVLPALAHERRLLAEAVASGVPVWGVCLGAQLLAAALGGDVRRGERPELGMHDLVRAAGAENDPVGAMLPVRMPVLQWHRDTFTFPEGARRLAGSDLYANQAFAVGSAYGVQFHAEVGVDAVRTWAEHPSFAADLRARHGPGYVDAVLAPTAVHAPAGHLLARALLTTWLDTFVLPQHDHQGVSL
ncbi:type 1 glutamine amidotransferase [Nocardioides sp. LHD-245]|uniref:type 1 glutamine amidotransferase n=1 Tax=Nocardioides sp. LHD-245 TaxID=3051387 RepID=UPI0027E0F46E|nr:type 1 glutamine amidotransferase [Nocardioides sp. LHD-245]